MEKELKEGTSLATLLEVNESRHPESQTTQAENVLDLLSDLQAEVNKLKAENKSYVDQLNKFRLGVFIPCEEINPLDVRPLNTRNKFSILELIKSKGMDSAQSVLRTIYDLAAEASSLIDVETSKKSIKIKLEDIDRNKKKEVKELREKASPEAKLKRIEFSKMEKAVNGIRKRAGKSASVSTLIPIVVAFLGCSDVEAKEALESIFAKEASAKR